MPTTETLSADATKGSQLEKPHKFENLDALRGVAAILIVVFHIRPLFGNSPLFGRAYLAVDLFFMLSGFVLSFAYQQKLDNGLPTTTFLKLRLIRLYPLYLIGLFLGFIYTATQVHYQHSSPGMLGSFLMLVPALFFLPIPAPTSLPNVAFPYDLPAWSLFSELIANLLHALLLRKRSTRTLLIALVFLELFSAELHCAVALLTMAETAVKSSSG
ncbi:MAG: acyltransferase [Acidobacteriaceae bacterium]